VEHAAFGGAFRRFTIEALAGYSFRRVADETKIRHTARQPGVVKNVYKYPL
jgi:hypothetical protein